ncbi:hypothetical protein F4780DRAFT_798306 [Xylariomycetidae sp. FL0641]|nr:hypothetical protein F4780DRAFT_798306 [Xylariomycetidae sp. FL0641]
MFGMVFLRPVSGAMAVLAPYAMASTAAVTYPIPSAVPSNAAQLDAAPIGVSFEFFMWPSYMTNISIAVDCLSHFDELYGKKTPTRIGGTTQDRAAFDPDFDGYVSYHVDDPLDAPMTLTYGPKFFDLIPIWGAQTILGLNRGDDNFTNTMEAALVAKSKTEGYLYAIELGNEPDLYLSNNKSVAVAPWNETQEGASEAQWAQAFLDAWGDAQPIISAGCYSIPIPLQAGWPNTLYLLREAFNASVKAGVRDYCAHLYALSLSTDPRTEMNHVRTASDVSQFADDVAAVHAAGKPFVVGETGFHGQDAAMDATVGGAVQVLDKSLLAAAVGAQQQFYHQGTIDQAHFNWWSTSRVEAPFYGGYLAALALAGGEQIVAGDAGNDSYARYVVFRDGAPARAVLVNTDYYAGVGARNTADFTLTGVGGGEVRALRFTAPASNATAGSADGAITIGGQSFSGEDCGMMGEQQFETAGVAEGQVTFTVGASEALLVYL